MSGPSVARLAARRAWAHAGLIGSIVVTVAVSVALLCGLLAWIVVDVRGSLETAIPPEGSDGGWVQVQTRPADDTAAQDAAASALFDALFGGTADVERITVGEADSERVAWRISPDRAGLDGAAVLRLERGLAELPAAFRASAAAVQGSEASGTLADTIGSAAQGVRASSAIAPVPVAIAIILAWFAVLELGRLLGAARGRETGLLRARGMSGRQSAVLSAAEAAVVAIAGGVVGFAAAVGVLATRPDGAAVGAAAVMERWPVAVAVVAVLAVTLSIAQSRAARIASSSRSGAGRIARAASAGAAVLVVLGAGVLVWQAVSLRTLPSDDPWRVAISALAPTFGVAAVGIVSVLLFAPLAAAVSGVAARMAGLSPGYPARQVARRVVAFSVAVALVAIASCAAMFAGAYGATWRSASTDSAQLAAGASLRADSGAEPILPSDVADARAVTGVMAAVPAIAAPIVAGELSGSIVALPVDGIEGVLASVPGAESPADLAMALASDPVAQDPYGAALPAAATGIQLTGLSTSQAWRSRDYGNDTPNPAADGDLTARGWVADAAGTVALVPFSVSVSAPAEGDAAESAGRRFTATGALPAGAAPWRLIAMELSRGRGYEYRSEQLRVEQLALAAVSGAGATAPEPLDIAMADVALTGWGLGLPSTAVLWSATGAQAAVVPAVVTSAFASALGLAVGEQSGIRFDGTGRSVTIRVAAIVDAIPGIGARPGVLSALDPLSASTLVIGESADQPPEAAFANQIWAAGAPATAAALSESLGMPVATPMDAAAAVTAGLVTAWWACALGGAVLAGVALIALLTALTGQRAGEVLVLRAVGVAPRRQSGMRAVEASVVVILAAVLGIAGGLGLSWLVVPGLAEAAVPGADARASLAVDPAPLLAALGIIAVAVIVVTAVAERAVRRQGASTRLEEAAP